MQSIIVISWRLSSKIKFVTLSVIIVIIVFKRYPSTYNVMQGIVVPFVMTQKFGLKIRITTLKNDSTNGGWLKLWDRWRSAPPGPSQNQNIYIRV